MVKICCIRGCKMEAYPGCGVSFHRFPKDELMREKWLNAIPGKPSKASVVCMLHFKDEDFHRCSLLRNRLKLDAVPSIFPEDSLKSDTQDQKNVGSPELCISSRVDEEVVMRKSMRMRIRYEEEEKDEEDKEK